MNTLHIQKRAIWWIAGALLIFLLALGWIVSHTWLGNQEILESSRVDDSAKIATEQIEDRHQGAQVGTSEELSSDEQVNLIDLLEACSELARELSEECLKALDAYFSQKPLVHTALSWVKFPNALTYATIFSDPSGDRARVFAALQNPECRFEDGESIRVDLKETCDAEAFARFSKFLEICEFGGDLGDSREIQFMILEDYFQELKVEEPNVEEIVSGYVSQKFTIEIDLTRTERLGREKSLETWWREERCTEHLGQVLAARNTRQTELLKEIGLGFNIDPISDTVMGVSPDTGYIGSFRVLRAIAHRLGADETVSSTYRPYLGTSDIEWDNHVSETRPWLDPWEKMLGKPSRVAGVQVAIDLALSLEDIGAEFDWDYLVERVCGKYSSDKTSCQTSLDRVSQTTEWTEKRKLQALDEFETRAIELGLYD